MPARSFRIIFSETTTSFAAFAASKLASDRPPALARSLWQPTQYCLTSAVWASASKLVGGEEDAWRTGAAAGLAGDGA